MVEKMISIKGKTFYLNRICDTGEEAHKTAKQYKKAYKSRYFIIKIEKGLLFPYEVYALYLTKIKPLW